MVNAIISIGVWDYHFFDNDNIKILTLLGSESILSLLEN
jgi:hypothetical protein